MDSCARPNFLDESRQSWSPLGKIRTFRNKHSRFWGVGNQPLPREPRLLMMRPTFLLMAMAIQPQTYWRNLKKSSSFYKAPIFNIKIRMPTEMIFLFQQNPKKCRKALTSHATSLALASTNLTRVYQQLCGRTKSSLLLSSNKKSTDQTWSQWK